MAVASSTAERLQLAAAAAAAGSAVSQQAQQQLLLLLGPPAPSPRRAPPSSACVCVVCGRARARGESFRMKECLGCSGVLFTCYCSVGCLLWLWKGADSSGGCLRLQLNEGFAVCPRYSNIHTPLLLQISLPSDRSSARRPTGPATAGNAGRPPPSCGSPAASSSGSAAGSSVMGRLGFAVQCQCKECQSRAVCIHIFLSGALFFWCMQCGSASQSSFLFRGGVHGFLMLPAHFLDAAHVVITY